MSMNVKLTEGDCLSERAEHAVNEESFNNYQPDQFNSNY